MGSVVCASRKGPIELCDTSCFSSRLDLNTMCNKETRNADVGTTRAIVLLSNVRSSRELLEA